ncbi:proton-conducting transporter transmembrane domain-containing protein [Jongsikchunia kroppenstedtii]|uniref:proton-conducting transporter transmembrane domain-containing protein n=1 Tax=Jongsikchunia kroppenstedtii TaxID=1121721 RepID=UPI0003627376|nr:proton-conducting transporter membrane subunit [Jongsikchunia kroppenstedtii]
MIGVTLVVFAASAAIGLWGRGRAAVLALVINAVGAILAIVVGARGMAGHTAHLTMGNSDGMTPVALSCDRLSGMFIVIAFAVALPAIAGIRQAEGPLRGRVQSLIGLALAAMLGIIAATSIFAFLFWWEMLTIAFYLLTVFERHRPDRPAAATITVVFGRASGAFLLAGTLLLVACGDGGYRLVDLACPNPAVRATGYVLLLVGFAIKVGLVPAHVWLPRSYSAAPAAARAVMAGAAVNVGFYGMWRVLDVLGPPPVWLACTVLVVGGVSAVYGIAQAAVNPRLPSLVAWSSVENAGMIVAGYGVALTGAVVHSPGIMATGIVAATAQVIAHAIGKSLLFVSTSRIETYCGETELDAIGGIRDRLPWSSAGLTVGALTLAGLPLTAGFTSEWLTLEALMQQFRIDGLGLQLCMTVTAALIALTIGVAALTFVRLAALTSCRADRDASPGRSRGGESWSYRVAVVVLIGCSLGVSALAPLQLRFIGRGVEGIVGGVPRSMMHGPWVIQPAFDEFSALSPSWLWVVLPGMFAVVLVAAAALSRGRILRVRRVPVWTSGSPGVERGQGYTSFAFANPMRTVLSNLLRTQHRVSAEAAGEPVAFSTTVSDVIDSYLYRPAVARLLAIARYSKRIQSGRLDAYMAYALIAVVAVLVVVLATK